MAERVFILTGGIGSGKSAAANLFAQLGIAVVDADVISHDLTASGGEAIPAIRDALGTQAIDANGALNRSAVRDMAFQDQTYRSRLESILHPMIQDRAVQQLGAAPGPYALYVVPLWLEKYRPGSGQQSAIKPAGIIALDCTEKEQIERVMQRSHLPKEQVLAIMASQISRTERLRAADHVLKNNGPIERLADEVRALHTRLIHS